MTFIKLHDVYSGEFYCQTKNIEHMAPIIYETPTKIKANTYIIYAHDTAARITETIEEILEIINNGS